MKEFKTEEILKSSTDLWNYLKSKGSLDTKYYDQDVEEELKILLKIPKKTKISDALSKKNISIELFLTSFFKILSPFSMMYNDLLRFLSENNVSETNNNTLVKFDFEDDSLSFEFDINQFKVCINKMNQIINKHKLFKINQEFFYKLKNIIEKFEGVSELEENELYTEDIKNWLNSYFGNGFKYGPLSFPKTKHESLNEYLDIIEEIINNYINRLSTWDIKKLPDIKNYIEKNKDIDEDLLEYANLECNCWTGIFFEKYLKVVHLINQQTDDSESRLEKIVESFEQLFRSLDKIDVEYMELLEDLEELLQLPIWTKRYDYYSIWVLTKISEALKDQNLRVLSHNGSLYFRFKGTLLAETDLNPKYEIWSELKSSLDNPVGKSRKKAIQPDYSIIKKISHPAIETEIQSTVLVVECKQYRKQNKKNFKEALIDYANGRPNADIILVNYGPAKSEIVDELDISIRARTQVIGEMKPTKDENIKRFKDLVRRATPFEEIITEYSTNNIEFNNIQIELFWQEYPKDLDLYIFEKGLNDMFDIKINYEAPKISDKKDIIEIMEDQTNGYGPEVINIKKMSNGKYILAVKNYSKEISLSKSKAEVVLKINKKVFNFKCPDYGEGDWWVILEVKNINEIVFHNKITENILV